MALTKANKTHKCSDCGKDIVKGEQYLRRTYPIVRGGSPEYLPATVHCAACFCNECPITFAKLVAKFNDK